MYPDGVVCKVVGVSIVVVIEESCSVVDVDTVLGYKTVKYNRHRPLAPSYHPGIFELSLSVIKLIEYELDFTNIGSGTV